MGKNERSIGFGGKGVVCWWKRRVVWGGFWGKIGKRKERRVVEGEGFLKGFAFVEIIRVRGLERGERRE